MSDYEYEVEMHHICKSFSGVKALQDVDFCVRPGEIHALMGENGAGKSTLIRCLSGVGPADSGEIKLKGKPVHISNPKDGILNGISVIYQEFALVQHLTVAENILLDDFRDGKPIVNSPETDADVPASTPLSDRISRDLKKRGFTFVGTTIVYSLLQSAGLVDDHLKGCGWHASRRPPE